MPGKCSALTGDGNPCKGTPVRGSEWCFSHHPDLAERRRQGAVKGGEGKSSAARARKHLRGSSLDPADVHGLLSAALVKVSEGKMEPVVGNALANMSKALVVIEETTVLTARLEELERRAGIEPSNVVQMRRTG
jgi:hypothetical protein